MTTRCNKDHAAIKADPALFAALESVGVQILRATEDEPEERHELRNCTCGGTLSKQLLTW